MTHATIEHVNLTVSNPERSARMAETLFGWKERWRGAARDGGFTIHVGSDQSYLAFFTGANGIHADARYPGGEPLNHVAIQVDDLDTVEERVVAHGLQPFAHGDYEPGRRFYFLDADGIEYEIVSYA